MRSKASLAALRAARVGLIALRVGGRAFFEVCGFSPELFVMAPLALLVGIGAAAAWLFPPLAPWLSAMWRMGSAWAAHHQGQADMLLCMLGLGMMALIVWKSSGISQAELGVERAIKDRVGSDQAFSEASQIASSIEPEAQAPKPKPRRL